MLSEQIGNQTFCIYGAGIVATSVYTAIKDLYHRQPLFFLISDEHEENEPKEIDGISVKRLSAWEEELRGGSQKVYISYYIIAVPESHHSVIVHSLQAMDALQIEASQILLITGDVENTLMEEYYGGFLKCGTVSRLIAGKRPEDADGKTAGRVERERSIQVFQARSHKDRPLYNRQQVLPEYISPIQAGAALTDQTMAVIQDNRGDHISAKNGNYSELTATYYAWKNSHVAYKGICHYRRIFDISEEQMQALLAENSEWDVILPYPTIHYPDIASQHIRYLNDEDWDAMLQALKDKAPTYLDAYRQMLTSGERFFYNFNMLIAKAEVFDDYCRFLFQVLERAEELATPKGWERADRFAGYMGEGLTTIYFHKNRDRFKVVYAGKKWLT